VTQVEDALCYKRFRLQKVSLKFFINIILLTTLAPWGRLQQKWVPGIFLGRGEGCKPAGEHVWQIYRLHDCLKIWQPQIPGTHWAWTGIVLPLPL